MFFTSLQLRKQFPELRNNSGVENWRSSCSLRSLEEERRVLDQQSKGIEGHFLRATVSRDAFRTIVNEDYPDKIEQIFESFQSSKTEGNTSTSIRTQKSIYKIVQHLDLQVQIVHVPGGINYILHSLSRLDSSGDYKNSATDPSTYSNDIFDFHGNQTVMNFSDCGGTLVARPTLVHNIVTRKLKIYYHWTFEQNPDSGSQYNSQTSPPPTRQYNSLAHGYIADRVHELLTKFLNIVGLSRQKQVLLKGGQKLKVNAQLQYFYSQQKGERYWCQAILKSLFLFIYYDRLFRTVEIPGATVLVAIFPLKNKSLLKKIFLEKKTVHDRIEESSDFVSTSIPRAFIVSIRHHGRLTLGEMLLATQILETLHIKFREKKDNTIDTDNLGTALVCIFIAALNYLTFIFRFDKTNYSFYCVRSRSKSEVQYSFIVRCGFDGIDYAFKWRVFPGSDVVMILDVEDVGNDSNSSFAYYELIRIIRIKANKLEFIISSSITQSRLRALNDDEEYVENVCDYEEEDEDEDYIQDLDKDIYDEGDGIRDKRVHSAVWRIFEYGDKTDVMSSYRRLAFDNESQLDLQVKNRSWKEKVISDGEQVDY
ncbi:MAG: hypothetical protein EZS28_007615 [Streblomastix strix]|uniref:Uncharacterized protein n=1 Tax=Streblomastix strix TaxID=222440 RepID=A0A5J4WPE2_9EUKA|nr:MAG: hypothetical protein EZS28_007615 [Streblomastix strix]